MNDITAQIAETVRRAAETRTTLCIRGGGTKDFYGNTPRGAVLDVRACAGIVSHQPSELVVTARAGTPLADIEAALAQHAQMLPFEPPHFGAGATFGGCVAAGLSGPRRPYAGGVRDFVLGVRMINGRGEILRFGGEVMKNVAGYDVSRLMAGSLGTLGVVTEVSLKVLPMPRCEQTLALEASAGDAIRLMNEWGGQPLPLSASCHLDKRLYLRLSGSEAGVRAARAHLGGEEMRGADEFWRALREHEHPFFDRERPLWRLSVPPAAPPFELPGAVLMDWGGAQRWLKPDAGAAMVREAARRAGGHATLFRGGDRSPGVFAPLPEPLLRLHRNLKQTFDPAGIFNPGRLYPGW
jgi:glycolate oxidase FAD binding subunit